MKKVLVGLGILLGLLVVVATALPTILHAAGLHPVYEGPCRVARQAGADYYDQSQCIGRPRGNRRPRDGRYGLGVHAPLLHVYR